MRLPDGFAWAAPALYPEQWCVLRDGASHMLCGRVLNERRERGFVPVAQPAALPATAHARCLQRLAGLHGMCPVCGADVALEDGLIDSHGQWQMTADGVERTDELCAGAGQAPEAAP